MRLTGLQPADLLDRSRVVSVPMRLTFRGISAREAMILEGPEGPAEWGPFVEYDDEEAAIWLLSAIEQGFSPLLPKAPADIDRIRVNGTIPAIEPAELGPLVKKFKGVRTLKVKVAEPGQSTIDDVGRLAKLRQLVGPDVAIRLDANGAWSVSEAERALFMLQAFNIDYVEQPVQTLDQTVRLKERLRGSPIRIAVDELIRKSGDVDAVLRSGAADLAVLKVNPLGGLSRSLEIARQAFENRVEVVVSSALETSVGLSLGATLQALLQSERGGMPDAGLGTGTFLTGDIVTEPLLPVDGWIPVRPAVVDPRKLKRYEAAPDRIQWWQERLTRCFQVLTDKGLLET